MHERVSLIVFVVGWLAAFPVLLHAGRRQWFFLDEWEFLANRELTNTGDLFGPYSEHWVTVPLILYRVTFQAVGLNQYWPYLLMAITAHLAAAALLRVVARRAGADPWTSTAGALVFTYFGSGRQNFGWGFQVGFSLGLACGLAHLVLADQASRRVERRDFVGVGFGLIAIMSTGVGVFGVLAVAVATLMRRGWGVALFHAGTPGLVYLTWMVIQGPRTGAGRPSARAFLDGFGEMMMDAIRGLAGGSGIAVAVLAVMVIGGLALGLAQDPERPRGEWSMPFALLIAGLAFALLTSWGRSAFTLEGASRYTHIIGAFLLPTVVVAVSRVIGRSWIFAVVGLGLFTASFTTNAWSLGPSGDDRMLTGQPTAWAAAADIAEEFPVPGDLGIPIEPFNLDPPTVGWIRSVRAEGKFNERTVSDPVRHRVELQLYVEVVANGAEGCETVDGGRFLLSRGQTAEVPLKAARVQWIVDGWIQANRDLVATGENLVIRATTKPIRLQITGAGEDPMAIERCG